MTANTIWVLIEQHTSTRHSSQQIQQKLRYDIHIWDHIKWLENTWNVHAAVYVWTSTKDGILMKKRSLTGWNVSFDKLVTGLSDLFSYLIYFQTSYRKTVSFINFKDLHHCKCTQWKYESTRKWNQYHRIKAACAKSFSEST